MSIKFERRPVHPFPARMAPTIALNAVSTTRRRLKILDPMMGSGTVLAAARARGHYAIGIDIDPLAVLLSRVWVKAIDKDIARKAAKTALRRAKIERQTGSSYPAGADAETKEFIRYWFDPYSRRQLAALARSIERCRNKNCRDVLWCAFSRLIITKQSGVSLALDLAHSRPHRHFKTSPIKPFPNFIKSVERVLESCISTEDKKRGPCPRVERGDARHLKLKTGTIDLVLTSPPYINAIDYLRCSKFSLVWMGERSAEIRRLRGHAVGTEVGDYQNLTEGLPSRLLDTLHLKKRLSRRKRAILSRFILDMQLAVNEVSRVLSPGGKAIYVVGENTIKGTFVQNAEIIKALATLAGLKLLDQSSRTLPPNRRYLPPPSRKSGSTAMNSRMRREVVLQFVKPKSQSRKIGAFRYN